MVELITNDHFVRGKAAPIGALHNRLVTVDFVATTPGVSELAKLTENGLHYVILALYNQLFLVCDELRIGQ